MGVELHFQKGLAGAPAEGIAAAKETPMNPAVTASFALAIIASEEPPAYASLFRHMPRIDAARRDAAAIERATAKLSRVAPDGGAYRLMLLDGRLRWPANLVDRQSSRSDLPLKLDRAEATVLRDPNDRLTSKAAVPIRRSARLRRIAKTGQSRRARIAFPLTKKRRSDGAGKDNPSDVMEGGLKCGSRTSESR
jgi:hypothetical protein